MTTCVKVRLNDMGGARSLQLNNFKFGQIAAVLLWLSVFIDGLPVYLITLFRWPNLGCHGMAFFFLLSGCCGGKV